MTGLSLDKDVLVEIAVLVTDSELNVIGEGIDLDADGPLAAAELGVQLFSAVIAAAEPLEHGRDRGVLEHAMFARQQQRRLLGRAGEDEHGGTKRRHTFEPHGPARLKAGDHAAANALAGGAAGQ